MKNIVLTDHDIPLNYFVHSPIIDLHHLHYTSLADARYRYTVKGYARDDPDVVIHWIEEASLLILVTKVIYGTFDVPMARLLERQHADKEKRYEVIDQKTAYANDNKMKKRLLVIGYGKLTKDEENDFRACFQAVSHLNFIDPIVNLYFCDEEQLDDTLALFGGADID